MLNKDARVFADKCVKRLSDILRDELLLAVLFGGAMYKDNPRDIDLFVCVEGEKPEFYPEKTSMVYYNLDEIKELIQGRGRGNYDMIRQIFLGGEVLFDKGYFTRINNAFAMNDAESI